MSSGGKDIVGFSVTEEDCGFEFVDYELGAGYYLFNWVSPDDIVGTGLSPFYYLRHLLLNSYDYLLPPVIRIFQGVNRLHCVADFSFGFWKPVVVD